MSKIGDLRDNKNNQINFINILETFFKDTKYITLYLKLFKNSLNNEYSNNELKRTLIKIFPNCDMEKLENLNDLELLFSVVLFDQMTETNINDGFNKFIDYNERHLIEKNDLQAYSSFDDIIEEVDKARNKENEKELEKQIIKLIDNEIWLVCKPLTYEASTKYGAHTKWCTTSKDDSQYFRQYSFNGILIYIHNKLTGRKFAIHRQLRHKETTYWDEEDNSVDLFDFDLPSEIYEIIKKNLQIEKTNATLFEEMKTKEKKAEKVEKAPKKPKSNKFKTDTEILDEVTKQYLNNQRWREYMTYRKSYDF